MFRDRTDVVPGRNSTRNCSGSIPTHICNMTYQGTAPGGPLGLRPVRVTRCCVISVVWLVSSDEHSVSEGRSLSEVTAAVVFACISCWADQSTAFVCTAYCHSPGHYWSTYINHPLNIMVWRSVCNFQPCPVATLNKWHLTLWWKL